MDLIIVFSLLLNGLMVLLVLYLVYRSDQLLNEFQPLMKEGRNLRQMVTKKSNEVLARTINLAQDLVRSSVSESQKNLKISESFKTEIEAAIKQSVEQTVAESKQIIQTETKDITDQYRSQFSALNEEMKLMSAEAKNEIVEQSKVTMTDLSQSLKENLAQIPQTIELKVGEQIAENEKSLQEYKLQKMKEVDEKIYQMIQDVAKKAIGRSLDLSTHEEIVVEALEKAKKEKIL